MNSPMLTRRLSRILPVAGVIVLGLVPLVTSDLYIQNMLILTFLLAIGASGWNVMGGFAGYISLGNSAFIGIGAYTTAILALRTGLSPFVGCLIGGLMAGIAAALLSLVTRRTRGMYFVIVTFAALLLLEIVAQSWTSVTGGSAGLAMPIPAWSTQFQDWPFYYGLLAVLVASIVVYSRLRRSKLGIGLFAIRDDEAKATGIGIRTPSYKLIAFALASTFTGIAGGLYAYYVSFLDPAAMFDIVTSVLIVLAALLGGRGTVWGPVLGAFIIEPLSEVTTTNLGGADSGAIRLLIFAAILLLVVLFLPRGVLPTIARAVSARRDRESLRVARVSSSSGVDSHFAPELANKQREVTGTALSVTAMVKAFGGVHAVSGVDLVVPRRSVIGLIGPNGSGKTTLFNLIDGTVRADSGEIVLAGAQMHHRDRASRAHSGIARTYQLPRLFPSLTVLENVVVPEQRLSIKRLFSPAVSVLERTAAIEILTRFGLAGFAEMSPADLSYGQRKLIELAQVLTLNPLLLLLDEPAPGISLALSKRIASIVKELHASGTSILLVEHDLGFVAELCDDVYVMSSGSVIAHGSVAELSRNQEVIEAYLGDSEAFTTAGRTS